MNCHTCKHNRRELAAEDAALEADIVNNCYHPSFEAGDDFADSIQWWIDEQAWDDECMCPEQTDPCPGFAA